MHDISLPGVSAADLGGPELASLGQAAQDLKSQKSRAINPLHGRRDRTLGPELPIVRDSILGPTAPELQAGGDVKSLHAVIKSSSLGSAIPLDKPSKNHGLGESYDPTGLERQSTTSHGAALAAGGGVRHQLPFRIDNIGIPDSASSQVQSARDYGLSFQQHHRDKNCRSTGDFSHLAEINRHELLGSERTQGLMPKSHLGKDGKHLGHAAARAQSEKTYPLPLSQTPDARGNILSLPKGQRTGGYLSAAADRQGVRDLGLVTKDPNGLRIRGTVAVVYPSHGSLNLQGRGSYGPVVPFASETLSVGIVSVEGQGANGFAAGGQEAENLYHAELKVKEPKFLSIPRQTDMNYHATRKSKNLVSFFSPSQSLPPFFFHGALFKSILNVSLKFPNRTSNPLG